MNNIDQDIIRDIAMVSKILNKIVIAKTENKYTDMGDGNATIVPDRLQWICNSIILEQDIKIIPEYMIMISGYLPTYILWHNGKYIKDEKIPFKLFEKGIKYDNALILILPISILDADTLENLCIDIDDILNVLSLYFNILPIDTYKYAMINLRNILNNHKRDIDIYTLFNLFVRLFLTIDMIKCSAPGFDYRKYFNTLNIEIKNTEKIWNYLESYSLQSLFTDPLSFIEVFL